MPYQPPVVTSEPADEQARKEPEVHVTRSERDDKIVQALRSYWHEADENRKGGMNSRDDKWRQNLDLYWGRHDFTGKAAWQAKQVMPEVPSFVDRFAAALKEALTVGKFYTVTDPADRERDLTQAVERITDVWLSRCGRNQVGTLLRFDSVFEEQVKMGALMACCSVTTWKNDTPYGRVAIETVDPRKVWLDHTYRNLYRIRRTELDLHELQKMASMKDSNGDPIFNLPEIDRLKVASMAEWDRQQEKELTGSGTEITSGRQPVTLDEYIATVVGDNGELIADRALCVLANGEHLIRGPEKNPFWHGKDWLSYCPLVTAPLSVYGRSYMEDFGSIATTFTELTNMILDAVQTSSLRNFAIVPGMLLNPEQVGEGLVPNKLWALEDGYNAEDFAKALDLGNMPPDVMSMWTTLKSELSEAAGINEIGLGQFAPNSRTSATEINQTQQSSSALIRSIASTIETRWLDPTLDLVWKTGLQHMYKNDPALLAAVGEDWAGALISRRKEFVERPFTFQARGISGLILKNQTLQHVMQLLQIVAQNENLAAAFFQKVDMEKLIDLFFTLSNVDKSKIILSEREQMIRQATASAQQMGEGGQPGAGQAEQMAQAARAMGIGG